MLGIAFVALVCFLAYADEEQEVLALPAAANTKEEPQRVFEWEFTPRPGLQIEHQAEPQKSRA